MVGRAGAAIGLASLLLLLATRGAQAQDRPPTRFAATIRVPADAATIQQAVDRVRPGGLVLISPGRYDEGVEVATPYVTIRGLDRNRTIIDADGSDDAILVVGADGVVVQNLTVTGAAADGLAWSDASGFVASFVTALGNGRDGFSATRSGHGQFDHSFAGGNARAGFSLSSCAPCDTVVTEVTATGNGVGYLGVNTGGDLSVVNGEWYGNGAGIVTQSRDDVVGAPGSATVIAGNSVHDNGGPSAASPAWVGAGIAVQGQRADLVVGNLVEDSTAYGIAVVPTASSNLWLTSDTTVRSNIVRRSGVADLALGAPTEGGDCFDANEATTSQPPAIETLFPCEGVRPFPMGGSFAPTISALARAASSEPVRGNLAGAPRQPQMPGDPAQAPPLIAVGGENVPQPFTIRDPAAIAAAHGPTVGKEIQFMGVPLATSWGGVLIGLYGSILPFALYVTWLAVAMWDLIRQESASLPHRTRWMLIVLIVPFIGPLLYFAFGGSPIPRQLRLVLTVGGIVVYLVFFAVGGLLS